MTVRLVARLLIAVATLVSSAILCWGQSPIAPYPGRTAVIATDSPAAPASLGPAPMPPGPVEGTWVSDKGQGGPPGPLPRGGVANRLPSTQAMCAQQPGEQGNWAEAIAATDDGQCQSGCSDGPCGEGARGAGPLCQLFQYHDLWTDTQSHRRIWVQPEYISWFTKGNLLPALVTTSPPGTPQTQAGVLPESAMTALLFGNERVDTQQRPGGRINFGYWLIDGEFLGLEGQYFALQNASTTYHADSSQIQGGILARPFIDANPVLLTPQEGAALLGFPNFFILGTPVNLTGTVDVRTTSSIQGADALLRKLIWIDFTSKRRLDVICGYRFFRFDDSVTINDLSNNSGGGFFAPSTTTSQDLFSARNQFHGGDIGLKFQQYCCSRFSAELIGKIALGINAEQVYITGSNTLTTLDTTVTNAGGLLTQASNIGLYHRDVFAILPEANANLRFDVTRNLRATLGYTFIYLNRVQRSGDAIDRTVNPTQVNGGTLTGDALPAFAFHDTSLWIHGFNAGFEYRW
jgi:hypothetical protein